MDENINGFLRGISASIATIKMYPVTHPQVKMVVKTAYDALQNVFENQEELIIGIVEDEIVFGKVVLFDVNAMLELIVTYAKKKDIEKMHFKKKLNKDELIKFVSFLITPEEETLENINDQFAMLGIKNIEVSKFSAPEDEKKKKMISNAEYYENFIASFPSFMGKLLSKDVIPTNAYLELKFAMFNIKDNLMNRHQEMLQLQSIREYNVIFGHSLNVSMLAMSFAEGLGFAHDDVLEIGLAALFHDMGRIPVSQKELLAEIGDKEDFAKAKNHSIAGAEILLSHQGNVGPLPVIVAFEHHLKHKPGPNQQLAVPQEKHVASEIVSICDFYDSICQRRSTTHDYSPKMIYELMMKNKRSFHPKLLEHFFNLMGVWPVGTIVALSDGRIAVVREINEGDKFYPKVEVLKAAEGEEKFLDLREKKAKMEIEKYLNPLSAGKPYLPFI